MSDMRATTALLEARRTYSGWVNVGVVFLASGLTIGSSAYAFALFIPPLEEHFQWQRTAIQASLSFVAVGALASPLLGRLMDRHGARPVLAGSLAVYGLSFVLRPFMTELWHWYALSFLQFVCFSGANVLPAGRLVGIWFKKGRGRAMGITTMGNNFGGATTPLITWAVMAAFSWQAAFVVLGSIAFVLAGLALVLVREYPAGQEPGGTNAVDAGGDPSDTVLVGWTAGEAVRTSTFYVMAVALALGSFTYGGVLPWVGAHLGNEGMAASAVPRAVSLLALFGMSGKLILGSLSDVITARRAMMVSLGGQALFILLLVAQPSAPLVWVTVALFGFCMGGYGALISLVIQDHFGLKAFGSISGLISMATAVESLTGPLMAGASFDLRGSYAPVFILMAALFVVAAVLLTQLRRPEIRSNE